MQKVLEYILDHNLFNNGDGVVLGISGGADSVCMLNLLNELKGRLGLSLYVVHVNHNIRGEEALRDQRYVEKMCEDLGVELKVISADVAAKAEEMKVSTEEAGRIIRYDVMVELCKEKGATKIAVAHNKDDNAETVLFNMFRGTGIRGMSGIVRERLVEEGITVVRPLLNTKREEILEYLKDRDIAFCHDSTNDETTYTRNKIRLKLMPYIEKEINKDAGEHIVALAREMENISDYLDREIEKAYNEYVSDLVIKDGIKNLEQIIVTGVIRKLIKNKVGTLKDVTRVHIEMVYGLLNLQVGKKVDLPYDMIFERMYDGIILYKRGSELKDTSVQEAVEHSENLLKVTENPGDVQGVNIPDKVYKKWLDYDKIDSLVLRHRQPGDFIVVDARGGRKKLKDYFIDAKIPRVLRDKVWLVADGSHIVWIVGHRISEACKVTESTKNIVRLEFNYSEE